VIRVVRLGAPRGPDEGLRLGTVRRPPRGVKKSDHARLEYHEVWLPELSPGTSSRMSREGCCRATVRRRASTLG
jgi:uncharacterized protein YeaO (DUF488 family)